MRPHVMPRRVQDRFADHRDRPLARRTADMDHVISVLWISEPRHQVAGALKPPLELDLPLVRVVKRLGVPRDQLFEALQGIGEGMVLHWSCFLGGFAGIVAY